MKSFQSSDISCMDYAWLSQEIIRVNKAFYSRVYKDAWISKIFRNVSEEHIANQQSAFMLAAFGGPNRFCGRAPADAHPHLFIDQEIWERREQYLKEAFAEVGFPDDLAEKWLRIDEAFKRVILKKSMSECKGRYNGEEIIYEPNPSKK